jgi:hypothetical protein
VKTSPTVRRVARAADHHLLAQTLSLVESDLATDSDHDLPATAIGLELIDDALEVSLRPLDPVDPVASLYGFTCPGEWVAFGLLTRGRARSIDAPDPQPEPVTVGLLVSRSGEQVTLLRRAGAEAEVQPGLLSEGRVPDACRRVLGLATPPPTEWAGRLWALMWVESLLVESLAEPGSLGWLDACRAHPAVSHILGLDASVISELPHRFIEMVEIISRQFGWERLRALAVDGHLAGFGIPTEHAAWMDDGMFSREVLGSFPPMAELLADLEPVTTGDILAAIEQSIDAWGVA